jgi:hypothetical protein
MLSGNREGFPALINLAVVIWFFPYSLYSLFSKRLTKITKNGLKQERVPNSEEHGNPKPKIN